MSVSPSIVPSHAIARLWTWIKITAVVAPCGIAPWTGQAANAPSHAQLEFFESRIRPILASECYDCHGATKQKGGLRLDSRDAMRNGGDSGPALIPGNPQQSLLVQFIRHEHPDFKMPKNRPKLAEPVIAAFEQWVKDGAPDPRAVPSHDIAAGKRADWEATFRARRDWWSFQPLTNPAPPPVQDVGWSPHPVDRFILAKLERAGIQPNVPAPPSTWLRRVHFVITGLPPTPEEIETFMHDPSHAGRARVIDRLLASPHFGERWARHWMDLVRFAETYGHEQDYSIPHAWQYRDYLIRAFNADISYDQFVKEHIAGDLLPTPRRHPGAGFNESIIGTGWWYLHQATHAPVDPPQDEADRIDNQIDVFSKTFLGLTIACARCHDHKFDPISSQDYYQLTAYLRGSRQDIAFVDPNGKLEPQVEQLRRQYTQESATLQQLLTRIVATHPPKIAAYVSAAREVLHGPLQVSNSSSSAAHSKTNVAPYARPVATVASEYGLNPRILESWSKELASPEIQKPAHPLHTWWVTTGRERGTPTQATNIAKPNAETPSPPAPSCEPFPTSDFTKWFASGQAFHPGFESLRLWRINEGALEFLPPGIAHSGQLSSTLQGTLRSPTFTITHSNIHLRLAGRNGKVRLIISRYGLREFNPLLFERTMFDVNTDGAFAWFSIHSGLHRHLGRPAYFEILDQGDGFVALDRIVFSTSAQPPSDPPNVAPSPAPSASALAAELETSVHQTLEAWTRSQAHPTSLALLNALSKNGLLDWGDLAPDIAALSDRMIRAAQDLPPPLRALAMADGSPEPTRVFLRGDPKTPGPTVSRGLPRALSLSFDESSVTNKSTDRGSGRLDLAHSLATETNPLLYRVLVNRVWAHVFGRGLVPTVDNFGAMGQTPTHPELLDYLAVTFRTQGGSLKQLIRALCQTEAFRMSSVAQNSDAETRDPDNALLHRMFLRRLEGESIRDALLASSGTLNRTPYGPSVPTYFTPFMGDRMWVRNNNGPMDGDRRRSIYLETRRNFLSPWMLTFDLPIPDTTVGQRNSSNVPGQALALMNDPFVQLQARRWAEANLKRSTLSHSQRIERLFIDALARNPKASELNQMLALLKTQAQARMLSDDAIRTDPELWADVCHVIFMMKEFTHVP